MLRARLRRLRTAERGSLAVFWVLSMLGFASLLAVVADGGAALAARRELQNAADAAALAGAQSLVLGSPIAIADAQLWAQKNASNLSVNQASTSGQVPGSTPSQIEVTLERDATGLFNGTLGLGRPTVRAQAPARVASLALSGPGVAPFAIPASTFETPEVQTSQPVTLAFSPPGSNSGLIRVDGGGASIVRAAMEYGSATPLEPVETTETGQNTGPLLQGLENRMQAALAAGCFPWAQVTASALDPAFPCGPLQAGSMDPTGVQHTAVLLIPVTVEDFTDLQGNQSVHVSQTGDGLYMVAAFWVDAALTFTDPLVGTGRAPAARPHPASLAAGSCSMFPACSVPPATIANWCPMTRRH